MAAKPDHKDSHDTYQGPKRIARGTFFAYMHAHDRFSPFLELFARNIAYPGSLGAQLENGQKTANNWTKNGFEIGSQKFAAIIALRKALHATRNNTNNAVCISAARAPPHSSPPGGAQPGVRGPPAPHPHRASTR